VSFAVTALLLLLSAANGLSGFQSTSVWIYGIGLVTVFATSATYNLWPVCATKLLLRRFDQSAIFLFIAASYTPFLAQAEQIGPNKSLLITIWAVAWFGVALKLAFPGRFERLSILLCLVLGWSGLFAYDAVFSPLPASTILLIVVGGILYSVGVVFHLWDRLRFQNAIWHAFVISATALQFVAILNSISAAVGAAA
jgi:hemolysin III